MVSNKTRGLIKERELKRKLIAEGWMVICARGSFGLFDIVAMNKHCFKFIQCKRVKGKYYSFKKEIQGISNFTNHPYNVDKELWIWLDPLKGVRKGQWIKKVIL